MLIRARWERVQHKVQIEASTGCHLWTGAKMQSGHGTIRIKKKTHLVHRIVYVLTYGRINDLTHIHHRCHNPACVNPEHLEALTPSEHMRLHKLPTKTEKPEPLECKRGHVGKFRKNTQGRWVCHACTKALETSSERKARRKERRIERLREDALNNKIDFMDEDRKSAAHRPNHTSALLE